MEVHRFDNEGTKPGLNLILWYRKNIILTTKIFLLEMTADEESQD